MLLHVQGCSAVLEQLRVSVLPVRSCCTFKLHRRPRFTLWGEDCSCIAVHAAGPELQRRPRGQFLRCGCSTVLAVRPASR